MALPQGQRFSKKRLRDSDLMKFPTLLAGISNAMSFDHFDWIFGINAQIICEATPAGTAT